MCISGNFYKAGETWIKVEKGERVKCTCHGREKGMWSCINIPADENLLFEEAIIAEPTVRSKIPNTCSGKV